MEIDTEKGKQTCTECGAEGQFDEIGFIPASLFIGSGHEVGEKIPVEIADILYSKVAVCTECHYIHAEPITEEMVDEAEETIIESMNEHGYYSDEQAERLLD